MGRKFLIAKGYDQQEMSRGHATRVAPLLRLVAFSSDAGHASFRGRRFVGATTSAAWIVSGARFRMSFLIRTGRTAMRAILHQASATFSLPEHMVPSIHMECRVINDRVYDSASAECHGREAE
jgi:hypothetical protein